eukprot:gene27702-36517_t
MICVAISIALLSFAVATGDTSKCCLPDDSVPSFRWKGGTPQFLDNNCSECDLLVNINSSIPQDNRTINVLSFGDSYELGFCRARPADYNYSVFQFVQHNNESKSIFARCTRYEDSINYMIRRMYGQDGEPKQVWASSDQSSLHVISEMGRYFSSATNDYQKTNLTRSNPNIDAVVFGSFLWDLKHWHSSWCRQILRVASNREANTTDRMYIALCSHVKIGNTNVTSDFAQPLDVETIVQSWGRMTLPWCDAATLLKWQETYLREVHALLDAFPQAVLFLRTQPISCGVFIANEHCHGPMNAFILKVWSTLQHLVHQSASGATLGRRVRLIAMHDLFQAPNDNGVDHFSDDNIHLTEDSFKVYRGYVMRVLDEYRTSIQ